MTSEILLPDDWLLFAVYNTGLPSSEWILPVFSKYIAWLKYNGRICPEETEIHKNKVVP